MTKELRNYFGYQAEENRSGHSLSSVDLKLAVTVILIAAAKADAGFADSEMQLIAKSIADRLHLSIDKVTDLINEAAAATNSLSLPRYIQEVKSQFPVEQREEILAVAWAVIAADGIATKEESAFARSLRDSLGLSMEQALRARKAAENVTLDGFKEVIEAAQQVPKTRK